MTNEDRKKLKNILMLLNASDGNYSLTKLEQYADLLLFWNKRVNLISRSDESKIVERHIAESLSVLKIFQFPSKSHILDLGTGGGFPGVPLAILRPDTEMDLLDSKRFKILFLQEVIERLELKNCRTIQERIENLSSLSAWSCTYDYVVTRAVSKLSQLYKWAYPLLKKNGTLIAWKGGNLDDEIDEFRSKNSGIKLEIIKMPTELVNPKRNRCLILIKK